MFLHRNIFELYFCIKIFVLKVYKQQKEERLTVYNIVKCTSVTSVGNVCICVFISSLKIMIYSLFNVQA